MNILQVSQSDSGGGAAAIALAIKRGLDARGIANSLAVGRKSTSDNAVVELKQNKADRMRAFLTGKSEHLAMSEFFASEQYKQADIVHLHNIHGRYFSLDALPRISREKKLIWTLHDEWALTPYCACTYQADGLLDGLYLCPSIKDYRRKLFANENRFSARKYFMFLRESYKAVFYDRQTLAAQKKRIYDATKMCLVAPSDWLRKRAERTPLAGQTIKTIPNGIDADFFKSSDKQEARRKLSLPMDKKIVFFVADGGRDTIYKGWNYALPVVSQSPDVLFICAGNDISSAFQEKNVLYLGRVGKDELAAYYSAADILLYPSLADNFPLVVLEAMACGLPILTFAVGGVAEAVEHKVNGYVACYGDSVDLLSGWYWLASLNRENLSLINNLNRQKIQDKFSEKSMVERYLELYESL